jgi:hypothetical protein
MAGIELSMPAMNYFLSLAIHQYCFSLEYDLYEPFVNPMILKYNYCIQYDVAIKEKHNIDG